MRKPKRKYDRDESESDTPSNESSSGPSVLDFVSYHKVEAFVKSYRYTENESEADEVFDEARLRSYFQAYPRPIGDPLVTYIELLEAQGFAMKTGIAGEPIICVNCIF